MLLFYKKLVSTFLPFNLQFVDIKRIVNTVNKYDNNKHDNTSNSRFPFFVLFVIRVQIKTCNYHVIAHEFTI